MDLKAYGINEVL